MSNNSRVSFEALVNFDASTLTGTYQVINGSGTTEPLSNFKFYNSSSNLVILSFDGTTDHNFIPPGSAFVADLQSNAVGWGGTVGINQLAAGTRIWAKTSSDTDRLIFSGYN